MLSTPVWGVEIKNEAVAPLLAPCFLKYAETGIEYTKVLKQIIEQNKLVDFDDAKILPSSKREKNLI